MSVVPLNMASPCTNVCVLDSATKLCLGCGRTGAEIGGWLSMSAAKRSEIMAQLPARLASIPGLARRGSQSLTPKDLRS